MSAKPFEGSICYKNRQILCIKMLTSQKVFWCNGFGLDNKEFEVVVTPRLGLEVFIKVIINGLSYFVFGIRTVIDLDSTHIREEVCFRELHIKCIIFRKQPHPNFFLPLALHMYGPNSLLLAKLRVRFNKLQKLVSFDINDVQIFLCDVLKTRHASLSSL